MFLFFPTTYFSKAVASLTGKMAFGKNEKETKINLVGKFCMKLLFLLVRCVTFITILGFTSKEFINNLEITNNVTEISCKFYFRK